MRTLFTFVILSLSSSLFLLACNSQVSFTGKDGACAAPDGTYPRSTFHEWQGVGYELPFCWEAEDEGSVLSLTHGEDRATVRLSFEELEKSSYEQFTTIHEEQTLYVATDDAFHKDVELIFSSLGVNLFSNAKTVEWKGYTLPIPLNMQSCEFEEGLYLDTSWEEGETATCPFVDAETGQLNTIFDGAVVTDISLQATEWTTLDAYRDGSIGEITIVSEGRGDGTLGSYQTLRYQQHQLFIAEFLVHLITLNDGTTLLLSGNTDYERDLTLILNTLLDL